MSNGQRLAAVEEVADSEHLARARAQRERRQEGTRRNAAWLQAHASEVYSHRGMHFCIAGEELFIADSAEDALAMGEAAHPEDDGSFVRYIPLEKVPR